MGKGRPSDYTIELAEEICRAIAECTDGLQAICDRNPHFPTPQAIRGWKRKNSEFNAMYVQAKQDQVDILVEEILQISDDKSHDKIIKINADGEEYEVCNTEYVNRSRLRVDTRKWMAAKLVPKIYGDRIQQEISGQDGKPIQVEEVNKENVQDCLKRIVEMALNKTQGEEHSNDNLD